MSKDTKKPHALFGEDEKSKDELIQDSLENDKYTAKIDVPIYEPKNVKPKISELIDKTKTNELVKEIKNSDIRDDEKAFLLNAAQRHTVYNYAKIADYYAYASPKMKELLVDLGLFENKNNVSKKYVNSNILLESTTNNDKYTRYVYEAFDIQDKQKTCVNIPFNFNDLDYREWNIGLIVGSSGSGKSTILKKFGGVKKPVYDFEKSIISQFPKLEPNEVCVLFTSVGLSSVPVWLRKPNELSFGEKARLDIAWQIANATDNSIILVDEFTSVVNRDVAKAMSYTLQKNIRKQNFQIIIASCHYDIIEWLKPDWIYNLNKQIDGNVRMEWQIYLDDKDYSTYKNIDSKSELSDIKVVL